MSERAPVTKAPASTAAHETPDEDASVFSDLSTLSFEESAKLVMRLFSSALGSSGPIPIKEQRPPFGIHFDCLLSPSVFVFGE